MASSIIFRDEPESYLTNNDFRTDHPPSGQYHNLYFTRLATLAPSLEKIAAKKWPKAPLKKASEIKPDEICVVIGVLYKAMKLKNRALDAFNGKNSRRKIDQNNPKNSKIDENNQKNDENGENLISDEDSLFLEEFEGRMRLSGLAKNEWATGFVVAVLGRQISNSKFHVDEISLAGFPRQNKISLIPIEIQKKKQYIAIVSGLRFGYKKLGHLNSLVALSEFLTSSDFQNLENNQIKNDLKNDEIIRLIIAGNSFDDLFEPFEIDPLYDDEDLEYQTSKAHSIYQLDLYLSRISLSVPIDIMPGKKDPANALLPQQAMHKKLFPFSSEISKISQNSNKNGQNSKKSFKKSSFNTVSNPFKFEINGKTFFASSGESVQNLCRHTSLRNLEAAEKILEGRHFSPTCPDTICGMAFAQKDELILQESPHVFLVGNMAEFSVKIAEKNGRKIRIVTVPQFWRKRSVVLCEIGSLNFEEVLIK